MWHFPIFLVLYFFPWPGPVASPFFSWWSVSVLQLLISVSSCFSQSCLETYAALLATTVNLVLCQKLRSDWIFASCEMGLQLTGTEIFKDL